MDIVLHEGMNELNVGLTPIAVPIAGSISAGSIWYEGLSNWASVTPGIEIPLNEEIYLAPIWTNESEIVIAGHIDITVTYPSGTTQTLSVISGSKQDAEAAPNNGWMIQFQPFVCSQVGSYTVRAILSSDGEVLDEINFTLVSVAMAVASLSGVVSDAETGYPISGVKVTLDGLVVYTSSAGEFLLEGLEPGTYIITFEKEGYETATM